MDLRLHVLGFFRLSDLILFKRATFSTPSHYHSRFEIAYFLQQSFCSELAALALSLLGYVSVAACTALLVSTSHTDISA